MKTLGINLLLGILALSIGTLCHIVIIAIVTNWSGLTAILVTLLCSLLSFFLCWGLSVLTPKYWFLLPILANLMAFLALVDVAFGAAIPLRSLVGTWIVTLAGFFGAFIGRSVSQQLDGTSA